MVDDTARIAQIYHALKAAGEVATALQAHLIEEHGADPIVRSHDSSTSSSNSCRGRQGIASEKGCGRRGGQYRRV